MGARGLGDRLQGREGRRQWGGRKQTGEGHGKEPGRALRAAPVTNSDEDDACMLHSCGLTLFVSSIPSMDTLKDDAWGEMVSLSRQLQVMLVIEVGGRTRPLRDRACWSAGARRDAAPLR